MPSFVDYIKRSLSNVFFSHALYIQKISLSGIKCRSLSSGTFNFPMLCSYLVNFYSNLSNRPWYLLIFTCIGDFRTIECQKKFTFNQLFLVDAVGSCSQSFWHSARLVMSMQVHTLSPFIPVLRTCALGNVCLRRRPQKPLPWPHQGQLSVTV